MCVCVCVCVSLYIYIYIYKHTYICIWIHVCLYMYIYKHTYIHILFVCIYRLPGLVALGCLFCALYRIAPDCPLSSFTCFTYLFSARAHTHTHTHTHTAPACRGAEVERDSGGLGVDRHTHTHARTHTHTHTPEEDDTHTHTHVPGEDEGTPMRDESRSYEDLRKRTALRWLKGASLPLSYEMLICLLYIRICAVVAIRSVPHPSP
jgi:hypothetical protein